MAFRPIPAAVYSLFTNCVSRVCRANRWQRMNQGYSFVNLHGCATPRMICGEPNNLLPAWLALGCIDERIAKVILIFGAYC